MIRFSPLQANARGVVTLTVNGITTEDVDGTCNKTDVFCRETNDGGCVNDEEIRDFTNNFLTMKLFEPDESCSESSNQCNDGAHPSIYSEPTNADNFTYTISSVGFGGTVRGLMITKQLIPYRRSSVMVSI